ncbi:hypothetical protein [Streptomyces abikoensis]
MQRAAPGVVIASVAQVRLLVVVMQEVKQTGVRVGQACPNSGHEWPVRGRTTHPQVIFKPLGDRR